MRTIRARELLTALAILTALPLLFGAASADPLTIRVGWSTMPGHLIPVLFTKPAILKHYGKSYIVQTTLFQGSSPQITAMAAREVDLVAYSPATLALTVLNAKIDVRAVADIIQDGAPGYHSETFLVRADSGIKSIADLKGKKIATNAIGSASDTAMRAAMRRNKLDPHDVTMIEAAFPTMHALLDEKKVDMTVILLPELLGMQASGKYTSLFTAADGWGRTQFVFLAGRGEFLDQNREVLKDFMEDYVRARRWFTDPPNRSEAVGIIAAFMKADPKTLDYVFTKDDYFRDPFGKPDLAALQSAIDVSAELGVIPGRIEVKPKYADTSFVEEAERRIKSAN
jgi:sulfonate transport system substrate-binding protein